MSPSRVPTFPPSARRASSLALAFAAGVAVASPGDGEARLVPFAAMLVPALLLGCDARPRRSLAAGAARLVLLLSAGIAAAGMARRADTLPALLASWTVRGFAEHRTPVRIRGVIADLERPDPDRAVLIVRSLGAPEGSARFVLPRGAGVRLAVPIDPEGPLPWRIGDRLETTARIGRPRAWRNPGAFDYAASLKSRDIDLTGSIKSPRLVEPAGREPFRRHLGARVRQGLARGLETAADEADRPTASFLLALLLGERQALAPDLEDRLKRAGVYHILALSGFNVALVAGGAALVLRLVVRAPTVRRLLLAGVVILYAAIARPGGSISRAALMVLLLLAARQAGRRMRPLGALAASSTILLAAKPAWLFDPGFQLSYAATAGLLLAGRGWGGDGDAERSTHTPTLRPVRALWWLRAQTLGLLAASAAALVATAPLTARHFHTVTLAGVVANLAAVPLSAACLGIGAIAAPLALLWPGAASALVAAATPLVGLLTWSAGLAADLPGASFFIQPPSRRMVALLFLLTAAGALLPRGRRRRCAWLLLVALAAALASRGRLPRSTGRLDVVVFDVGQGDAILVRLPSGGAMLIDAGGLPRGDFDPGARVVAPALRALGVLRLDLLVLTHPHRDHIAGGPAILGMFRPEAVWVGAEGEDGRVAPVERAAEAVGASVLRPRGGIALRFGGARLEVLNPPGPASRGPRTGKAGNDDSIVIRLRYGRRSVLLTGDMERPAEERLLAERRPLRTDLLKVAHHGSDTSTSESFLEAVAPLAAVVSAGASNPWGHPSPQVLGRLDRAGVAIFRTDRHGAVRARTDGLSPWRIEPLTSAPGDPEHLGSDREEGQDEQEQAEHGDGDAAAAERLDLVEGPRVPDAEDPEEDSEHHQMVSAEEKTVDHQDRDPGARDERVHARRQRVQHVATVQLPDRQQVQRGGEQPEPGGDEERMERDGHPLGRLEEERVQERQEEARRQSHVPRRRGDRDDGRTGQTVDEDRQERHESGDRPGDPDVEQGAPGGEGGADPDHRAERAEQVRSGKEVRERGIDPVQPAGDVMPHLVAAEDEQGGEGIRQTGPPGARRPEDPEEELERERLRPREHHPHDGRRQERQQEEEQVDRAALRPRRRLLRRARHGPGFGRGRRKAWIQLNYLRFRRFFPGLKRIVLPGGIRTSVPVLGLRPIPFLRGFTWNTPKPRSSIRSPRRIDSFIASRIASTATTALTRVISAVRATLLMMSLLITPFPPDLPRLAAEYRR